MNTDFLIVSYIVGMFVDWVFQTNYQAFNKSKWGANDNKFYSLGALCRHSLTYSFITTIVVTVILNLSRHFALLMYIVLLLSHAIIDTRIPVKFILKLKGLSKEQINDSVNFGYLHIGVDQRLHELVLLVLAFFIK